MLHLFYPAPFADPARETLFQVLRTALQDDANAPTTLLLGNLTVVAGQPPLDAVVVRPNSITLLVLVPGGGRLGIPALTYGTWQLNGHRLAGQGDADNPYEQFVRQKEALAAWLGGQLSAEQANLRFISGLVVFGAPVTFGPEVEEQLSLHPGAHFQLLGAAEQLPRRLKQLARPEVDLSEDDIEEWGRELAGMRGDGLPAEPAPAFGGDKADSDEDVEDDVEANAEVATKPVASPWAQLWSWLGADDIPLDTPYGQPSPDVAASNAEMRHLEQLQRETQAQVAQQLRALEAREAERERSMAELRTQLAQAPPVTDEAEGLRERLAAESREKAAVEAAIRASRAEADARNQALDAKISQLGQLIEQLNAQAAAPPAPAPVSAPLAPAGAVDAAAPAGADTGQARAAAPAYQAPGAAAARPAPLAPPVVGYRRLRVWRRRLPRLAAVAGVVAVLGLGVWGLSHLGTGTLVPYQENGKWGLADQSGQPVVPAKYTSVGEFKEERALVEANGAYGLVDPTGKEVVAPAYDALNPYAEGYARVRVGDAYTFLDRDGQEFDAYYFNALDFAEGYAAVLDHRGWHYISGPEAEDPAHPPVLFQEAYSFRNGLARVRLTDGYTYITKDYLKDPGEGTKPFGRYELAADFEDGKARVTQSGRSFLIDTDGEEVK